MEPKRNSIFSWKKEGDSLFITSKDGSNAASIPLQKPFMWRFMAKDWEGDRTHIHPIFRITIFSGSSMRVFVYEDKLAWALYYWATQFAEKYSWGTLGVTKSGCVLYDHEPDPPPVYEIKAIEDDVFLKIDPNSYLSKLDAINFIRTMFGPTIVGLKEAKDFIDSALVERTQIEKRWLFGRDLDYIKTTFAKAPFTSQLSCDQKLKISLWFKDDRQKLAAIRYLRGLTGSGLKETKEFCDSAFMHFTEVPKDWYNKISPLDFFSAFTHCDLNCEVKQQGLPIED